MKIVWVGFSSLLVLFTIYSYRNDIGTKQKFIETQYMDSSVKPGDNFFLFVNGRWIKNTTIPPTESGVGSFLDVYNGTKGHLKSILDSVSKVPQAKGSLEQKVGDFYASGMDSVTIDKRGYEPIKPYLQQINALKDAKSIMQYEAQRHKEGFSYIAGMSIGADDKNSSMNIAAFYQSGIGLPDRDYYFKTDEATMAIQNAYKKYMQKTFMLIGDDSVTAAKKVEAVYALEKQMAESHRTRVELRDPQSNYNKMAIAELDKKMPAIGWSSFLNNMGAKTDSLNVGQPAYYTKLNSLLNTVPVNTWKAYYKFHVTDDAAPYLSSAFVNAKFDYSRTLSGQQQIKPRWERMYRITDSYLGEALGQLYVKKYFTDDAKQRMLKLVSNLQKSFENHIEHLDWMSDATKAKAKDKLYAFMKKIGFPDKWRDYSKVTVDRKTFFENLVSAGKNEYQYQLSKLNKPVDKTEWGMTPPTINAYYNPTFNEIVFPAGILQFPFFDPNADDAINYGGIGMVIGHEMTHGFDDQGAQYDKEGNLKNWWASEDSAKFVAKSKSVIDLYNTYTVLDTLHVNGSLTTGENMADIGGIAIAYDAFKMTKQGQDTTKIDGFTPDQRFFISLAQIWRNKQKDQTTRLRINTDPHSPAMYRVNGPLQNFTPFYAAFNVKPGDKMYLPEDKRIKIW
ncbi:M13 family metallopeptidase [Segetibacter koreensis]|uniref:M13 family metallopeptidase n=1 Tax=Segetibacter koreensis TaxID=398037 RepID=UPI0003741F50|nr:M13 family metallopeptidase [Segetibacter koreensis]